MSLEIDIVKRNRKRLRFFSKDYDEGLKVLILRYSLAVRSLNFILSAGGQLIPGHMLYDP